ncbi:hypothetical protein BamMEX5DRAFT_6375 [Burkholderia ambifaria MEX-5]|uniref:Uncharacterized protein n=1 Tax=Burkholderia ambifaria MEX-5 TaxID=396597 RepID=B1TF09_9BURK|nr:hypothetical protein BamMEX5DRAFT_6375 [Burkholderia ambifaria MEX-5]
MTYRLCQRPTGTDRTIRLFSGGDGRWRTIDANLRDRRARTRVSCRRGRSIRPFLLWECLYDKCTVALPPAEGPHRQASPPR